MFIKFRTLLNKSIFNTSTSRKQTTPKLFRDPRYTKRGITKIPPKNYNYDLDRPQLKNKHLYYNNAVQNRIKRYQAHLRRLKRLGIRPILRKNQKLVQRPIEQILKQLRDRKVITHSLSRTYTNLFQLFSRFPEQISLQSQLIDFVLNQIQKQIYIMTFYQFSHFCMFQNKLKKTPKVNWLTLLYLHLYTSQVSKSNLRLDLFALMFNYLFTGDQKFNNQILYKNKEKFKIFEDNDPRPKSIEQLTQKVFNDDYLKKFVNQNDSEKVKKVIKLIQNLPGTTAQRLQSLL